MRTFRIGTGSVVAAAALSLASGAAQAAVFTIGDDIIAGYASVQRAPACGAAKIAEVLATPTAASNSEVELDCSFTMPSGAGPIKKTILISGSGGSNVVVDCRNAALTPIYDFRSTARLAVKVRSKKNSDGSWSRPSNVTIKNCEVAGRITVTGLEYDDVYAQSRAQGNGFTAYAQSAAPTGVLLDTLSFIGHGGDDRGHVYFSPGVTHSTVRNSTFDGNRSTPEIYLDHESGHNLIKNNNFFGNPTTEREVIAVDGSAYNIIEGNYFSGLNHGGIYIYRNCGQDYVIRVQQPAYNQIINNVFYYNEYGGPDPSIWIGERDTNVPGYCDDDDGYNFGSSASDADYAHDNVVAENRFFKFQLVGAPGPKGTYIMGAVKANYAWENYYNEAPTSSQQPRPSGCYVRTKTGARIYVKSGESVGVLDTWLSGRRYECSDGMLIRSAVLSTSVVPFSCARSGNNAGCTTQPTCPGSAVKVAVAATCHLEAASYPTDYATVPWNVFSVARPSDPDGYPAGVCGVNTDRGNRLEVSSGRKDFSSVMGWGQSATAYCHEHDENGGDCAITGDLLCL
jgi:hypothetical protein